MTTLKINRMQEMFFVNYGNINSVSEMNCLENSINECKFPSLVGIEPKYTYAFYLLADMKTPSLSFRMPENGVRNNLFLSSEGRFSYKSSSVSHFQIPYLS